MELVYCIVLRHSRLGRAAIKGTVKVNNIPTIICGYTALPSFASSPSTCSLLLPPTSLAASQKIGFLLPGSLDRTRSISTYSCGKKNPKVCNVSPPPLSIFYEGKYFVFSRVVVLDKCESHVCPATDLFTCSYDPTHLQDPVASTWQDCLCA